MSDALPIDLIHRAALQCDLAEPARRPLLLAGLPADLVGRLALHARPGDQLLADLHALAAHPRVEGLAAPPLTVWLQNAARLARGLPEAIVFERLLALHSTAACEVIVIHRAAGLHWNVRRPVATTCRALRDEAMAALGAQAGITPGATVWLVRLGDLDDHPVHPQATLGELAGEAGAVAFNLRWAPEVYMVP